MDIQHFWQYEPQGVITELQTSLAGLSKGEAAGRLAAGIRKKAKASVASGIGVYFFSSLKALLLYCSLLPLFFQPSWVKLPMCLSSCSFSWQRVLLVLSRNTMPARRWRN